MKTPESSSGLRIARFWKTNASISMPVPAIAHAISEPRMPVATPNRAGSEKTPAPTMPPTTIAVSVGTLIFATTVVGVASLSVVTRPPQPGSARRARDLDRAFQRKDRVNERRRTDVPLGLPAETRIGTVVTAAGEDRIARHRVTSRL